MKSSLDYADRLISHYKLQAGPGRREAMDNIMRKIDDTDYRNLQRNYNVRRLVIAGISAAALILLLITFYFFTATIVISTGDEDIVTCRLPDHSRVILHDDSKIEFRKYRWNRQVELYGEAYFEVVNGTEFQVKTKKGNVEVLGTRFLVEGREDEFIVHCYHGKVRTKINDVSWILDQGNKFSSDNRAVEKEIADTPSSYPEFAKFTGNFSDVRLTDVVGQLEVFFNVRIEIQKGISRNFTGSFSTGNLESALQIVCRSLRLEYRYIDKNRILIHNI